MKLSPSQINTLKKLISYKGYPEIDLQYEILDHVACKVEVLLEEKPTMSLDDAFRKVHSEFGIFGFSDLAESYTKSIEKRYRRFFWEEFIAFFTSYRIIYPAAIGFILYWLSVNTRPFGYELSLPVWGAIFFFASTLGMLFSYGKTGKKLKNYVAFKSSFNAFVILNTLFQINLYGMRYLKNPDYSFAFTFQSIATYFMLVFVFLSFISVFLIPRVLDRSIAETKKLQAVYES
ncbi:hypothetical protein PBT90_03415 [Algoriphagus halophytocola]|uniref:Uncharacterized protein n=1 Tax=Algoriphagus halophytocola TaxID=2991499 RepID=A0ABY6MFA3_9BACT|nr:MULTISPECIES: hypothetical protein [unclassified Algoriphagus]UZD22476.1 hypothetical protein OM944_17695 [Algoriphagus sp. TR-M5]WBL43736.1 hypothetical protein PBT90_03415 [Algoriphagus sp. TR-M9]